MKRGKRRPLHCPFQNERMSGLGTCCGRSAIVKACDLQCRCLHQWLQRNCIGIFRSSGMAEGGAAKRSRTRGPPPRTASGADVSHSREPTLLSSTRNRAFGSECGLDADAFTVGFSLQSADSWAGMARPGVVSCVRIYVQCGRASPSDECWACSGASHALHTRCAPLCTSHISRQPGS